MDVKSVIEYCKSRRIQHEKQRDYFACKKKETDLKESKKPFKPRVIYNNQKNSFTYVFEKVNYRLDVFKKY